MRIRKINIMKTTMNNLVDIHNHSLPGVDDGAKSISETISNIAYLKELGYTDIVLTSHYIEGSTYNSNVKTRKEALKKIKKEIKGVNFYLGNEVYIVESAKILELLKTKEIMTINDSRYLLIELPMNNELMQLENILQELNEFGIIPIIAHPERYKYFQKRYHKINHILDYNCLLQVNLESINGMYGRSAKKLVKYLLKKDLVSCIATDFHHVNKYNKIDKALKKLQRIVKKDRLDDLLINNPKKIINNEDIENV